MSRIASENLSSAHQKLQSKQVKTRQYCLSSSLSVFLTVSPSCHRKYSLKFGIKTFPHFTSDDPTVRVIWASTRPFRWHEHCNRANRYRKWYFSRHPLDGCTEPIRHCYVNRLERIYCVAQRSICCHRKFHKMISFPAFSERIAFHISIHCRCWANFMQLETD